MIRDKVSLWMQNQNYNPKITVKEKDPAEEIEQGNKDCS